MWVAPSVTAPTEQRAVWGESAGSPQPYLSSMQGMRFCIADTANKICAFTDQTGLSVLLVRPLQAICSCTLLSKTFFLPASYLNGG